MKLSYRHDGEEACNMKNLYLIVVYDDIEPKIEGPFDDEESRDRRSRQLKEDSGDENGIFPLDIVSENKPEAVSAGAYRGGFFEEEEEHGDHKT